MNNYTAWRSFGAYLIYGFRGVSPKDFGSRSDDLVWRWSRAGNGFVGLANELLDNKCAECAPPITNRFVGLSAPERLGRLLQDWRIANYVNNAALADSQYGFPPYLGFVPWRDVGNFQDRDLDAANNADCLPPEVTVTPAWRMPRWYSYRPAGTGFPARRMRMPYTGAEYFVFRPDPALDGSLDFVLRTVGDSIGMAGTVEPASGCAPFIEKRAQLWMSAVLYAQDDDSLFVHPEHATQVLNTRITLDSLRAGADLTVTGFGGTVKAVVLVLTLADQGLAGGNSIAPIPISIHARLRPAQYSTAARIVATAGQHDDSPTWSPTGGEIAFSSRIPGSASHRQIFRVPSTGGTPQALAPATQHQRNPDWSPRGDLIVFEQDAKDFEQSDLWMHDLVSATSYPFVSKTGSSLLPVFQPNGQMVAYVFDAPGDTFHIRKVRVDSAGDSLVVALLKAPSSLRWSPDGLWLWYSVLDTYPEHPEELIHVPYRVSRNGGTPTIRLDLVTPGQGSASLGQHPNGSLAVLEQTGEIRWGPLACLFSTCACWDSTALFLDLPVLTNRVLLRDLNTADQVAPFQDLTTCRQYFPRLAPDGIRIAYSQNDSNATSIDRDIIVRKLGDHAPPAFASPPGNQTFETGPGNFVIDLDATDPEGLAVTFQGVQLPSGASFSTSTGVFTWPHPPANTTVHPVFRALDASSGVATVIPQLAVTPAIAPSAVGELVGDVTTSSSILMTWMAPGDDTTSGTATLYDVR